MKAALLASLLILSVRAAGAASGETAVPDDRSNMLMVGDDQEPLDAARDARAHPRTGVDVRAAIRRVEAPPKSLNPDRWTTLEFTEGGESSFKGDQIRSGVDNRLRNRKVTSSGSVLFPVNDAVSLTIGAGGVWTQSDLAVPGANGSNYTSDSDVAYTAGVRYYFEDPERRDWTWTDNPDRWPSLGLTYNGYDSVNHSAGNAVSTSPQAEAVVASTLGLDARLPLADAWTLLLGVADSLNFSNDTPTPTATGSRTRTDIVAGDAGFRYYVTGWNLITDDVHENPDRWLMLSLVLAGGASVYDRQTIRTTAADVGTRDNGTWYYTATASARIPITPHASLTFTGGGGYNRSESSTIPSAAGTLTRLASLNFSGTLRYFLF